MENAVYTIGHSTHSIERLIELLKMHSVTAVCDVRSTPYSRMNPQFNRESLRAALQEQGLTYVFLGEELGARSNDPNCYRNGKVQYDLLSRTAEFLRGLERVTEGSRQFRMALMCAEKDPLECHRTILVARRLVDRGVPVRHILADGKIETQEQTEERLLNALDMSAPDLFRSKDERLRDAYRKQGEEIAYSVD